MIKTFITVLKYDKDDEVIVEHDNKINAFLSSREGEINVINIDNQVLNTGNSYGNRIITFVEYENKPEYNLNPVL
jgi:hypothetical protein